MSRFAETDTQNYLYANPAIDEEALGEFACGPPIYFTLLSALIGHWSRMVALRSRFGLTFISHTQRRAYARMKLRSPARIHPKANVEFL